MRSDYKKKRYEVKRNRVVLRILMIKWKLTYILYEAFKVELDDSRFPIQSIFHEYIQDRYGRKKYSF